MKHQILSTTKQGKVGTEVLNRTLEAPADADSLIYHDYVYRAGDKVVFVSNNYKAGYCNGDVGVITEIHNGMTVSLGDETVSLGEYDLDEILPADVINPIISAHNPQTPPATGPSHRPARIVHTLPTEIRYAPRSMTRTRVSTRCMAIRRAMNTNVFTFQYCFFCIIKTPP